MTGPVLIVAICVAGLLVAKHMKKKLNANRPCWCQLAGLRTLLQKDESVKLFAISVDPPDVSKNFAEKIGFDGKGPINSPFLSDPEHKTIDEYGLRDPAYEGQKVYGIPQAGIIRRS